jgi:hypothetical protein
MQMTEEFDSRSLARAFVEARTAGEWEPVISELERRFWSSSSCPTAQATWKRLLDEAWASYAPASEFVLEMAIEMERSE